MTIGDLIHGVWTWHELLKSVVPIVTLAGTSFWAGFERGKRTALEDLDRRSFNRRAARKDQP